MELTLELKQAQTLSPQMIQAMEILQMGTQELQAYVEKSLLENPTLELEAEQGQEERPEVLRRLEWLMTNDRQNRCYYREDAVDLAELVADTAEESLCDHLRDQLDMERLPRQLAAAVDCVLSGLNDAGYLEESSEELASRCGQPVELIHQAERIVHTLEPAGVGARTLSECLAQQLERQGETGLALTIAQKYLEDMARNHFHRIAKETGADRVAIQAACDQIRALDPRPGASFAPQEAPEYVIPDLLVTEENGALVVTAGEGIFPVLQVSSYYQQLMRDTDEIQVQTYLADKVKQAQWLVKSIEQRRSTLLSCARVIAARQESFFLHGAYLNPMTLADVAAELDIHESTVSRAIRNKYLQSKKGVFPLSYFFSRGLPAGDGDSVSSECARAAMKALIDQEDKSHPISDQKLCELLAKQNILLSRRTVAKYRDMMGIPSTSGRKRIGNG